MNIQMQMLGRIFLVAALTTAIVSVSSAAVDTSIAKRDNGKGTLLGLFYGMEMNSEGEYVDSVLDPIAGMTHREFSSDWYIPTDSVRFKMTLGIYLDNEYPTDAVRKTVFKKLNTVIPEAFTYDSDKRQASLVKKGVKDMRSAKAFLDGWEILFDEVSQLNGYTPRYSDYPEIVGTRGCAVCHKLYEDSAWATYLVEMSYDYHSSSGCPSRADYYTVDKRTGQILNGSDFIDRSNRSEVADMLRKEYEKEARAKGFTPSQFTGRELIDKADGIAKIDEGLIIYFHPYSIGCGAEGQYNLIIPASLSQL